MGQTSQQLFEEIWRELTERGLHGTRGRLEQYRAALQAEHGILIDEIKSVAPNKIQAGLPAEEPQPTEPIP